MFKFKKSKCGGLHDQPKPQHNPQLEAWRKTAWMYHKEIIKIVDEIRIHNETIKLFPLGSKLSENEKRNIVELRLSLACKIEKRDEIVDLYNMQLWFDNSPLQELPKSIDIIHNLIKEKLK